MRGVALTPGRLLVGVIAGALIGSLAWTATHQPAAPDLGPARTMRLDLTHPLVDIRTGRTYSVTEQQAWCGRVVTFDAMRWRVSCGSPTPTSP